VGTCKSAYLLYEEQAVYQWYEIWGKEYGSELCGNQGLFLFKRPWEVDWSCIWGWLVVER